MFRLNPILDPAPFAEAYRRDGVVQIPEVLDPASAEAVAEVLKRATPWRLVYSDASGQSNLIEAADAKRLGAEEMRRRLSEVNAQAAKGFAYVYLCYPMIAAYVRREDPGLALHGMTELLNSPEFLAFGREVVGAPGVTKVDAQATWYRPNDYLTLHDDTDAGQRRAAYTLGFTRGWRPDWGGQLLFHDDRGDIERGLTPGFNVLTLFRTPRLHSVAPVAPYARSERLSIVGWLRDDPPSGSPTAP